VGAESRSDETASADDAAGVSAEAAKAPMAALGDSGLENTVRVADEDRWLASRFAPKAVRQRLIALYAFNVEVARIAERVNEPRLGEIRLQWWREATEDIFRGGPVADHPTARALAELVGEINLPLALFDEMLTARVCDLSAAPFATWTELESYIDGTAGALLRLAALICAPDLVFTPQRQNALQIAGRAWGLIGLLRALPAWTERGRTFFPSNLRGNLGLGQAGKEGEEPSQAFAAHAVLDRAVGAQKQFERYAAMLPKEIFPAIGCAALAPLYLRALLQAELGWAMRPPGLFARKVKLVMAAASGRL
jgi:15-cis-phytoene synthase